MKMMQKIDRRHFIEAAASAAALGGIGLPLSARSAAPLAQLRSAVRGHVITPADSAYRSKSEPWNARFANVLPAAIVIVADAHDVGRTIAFAREHGLPFVVRNGGHSFAGFSASHGLIVDVSALREVRIDSKNQRATFGAGFTNLALYERLWPARMSLPAGTCPTVGVTGLSQAGGFGRLSRLYGLTCDNILELKVVDASGDVLTASDTQHSDLLWACRGGGGGNFGAVVELTARIHPVDMSFTEIAYTFPLLHGLRVLTAMQDWIETLPPRGHVWAEIVNRAPSEGAKIIVEFTLAGSEKEAFGLGHEFLSAAGVKPSATSVETGPYISTQRGSVCAALRLEECAYTGVSGSGRIPRPAFYAKSDLIRKKWPAEAFSALIEAIARRQADRVLTPANFNPATQIGKVAFESAGGAISQPGLDAMAFAHRDIRIVTQYQARWQPGSPASVARANIAWTQAMYDSVRPWLSGSAYQGYADPFLSDWQHQYYGTHVARLNEIKHKYDPENVFTYAQSLGRHSP
ncbi:MAG TPA: FAD-binding oxidoreductase [Candidatus Rubrimentiphilum sp.]|nr:FAD-binding oxidoreductase [Candidatus Rubrimentiphilum sp.]